MILRPTAISQRGFLLSRPLAISAGLFRRVTLNVNHGRSQRAAMTSLTVDGIPVTLPKGLSEEQLRSFHPFNTWLKQLQRSLAQQTLSAKHPFHSDPYYLRSITVQSFDLFGKHRVGFLKLQADVRTADGKGWLPGAVFLRGSSVAVLFVLVPDDSEESSESYVVLTVQPRVAAGSLALSELPAGMVDDEGQFAGTAAKEIQEELGVEVKEDDLVSLTDLAAEAAAAAAQTGEDRKGDSGGDEGLAEALFPSPGACDETMRLYAHVRRVPRAQLQEWQGRLTGLRSEGEKITLKVVPFQDAVWEARRDGKALAALALWEGLRRTGRLPENLLRPR